MNFLTTLGEVAPHLELKVCEHFNIKPPFHLSFLSTIKRRNALLWYSLPYHEELEALVAQYKEYNLPIKEAILPPSKEGVRALVLEVFKQTHGITNPTMADLHYYATTEDESFSQNLTDAGVSSKDLELFWS